MLKPGDVPGLILMDSVDILQDKDAAVISRSPREKTLPHKSPLCGL